MGIQSTKPQPQPAQDTLSPDQQQQSSLPSNYHYQQQNITATQYFSQQTLRTSPKQPSLFESAIKEEEYFVQCYLRACRKMVLNATDDDDNHVGRDFQDRYNVACDRVSDIRTFASPTNLEIDFMYEVRLTLQRIHQDMVLTSLDKISTEMMTALEITAELPTPLPSRTIRGYLHNGVYYHVWTESPDGAWQSR
eukprot:PhF_6_TR38057/c0_g1_i1/m.56778